jgi:acetolactate synthase-1/2/3 large subunit
MPTNTALAPDEHNRNQAGGVKKLNSTSDKPFEVADLLIAYLEQIGVEYIFGVPGGAIEPLYNALARSGRRDGPRPMLARHESGAAFMADGYARETGKLGVCCATSGPGATNLITGVACAYDNSIPLLVITGQPALPAFGKRALQESSCTGIDTLGMLSHCTHYNSLVSHPDQLEQKLITALMRATRTPRGPVHLSFPVDVFRSASKSAAYDLRALLQPPAMLDENATASLAGLVKESNNVVIVIGGGCGEAAGVILQFAELVGANFVTTPDGKGFINPDHPLYRGVFGFAGHVSADAALRVEAVDLIIAIGTSMGEWTSSGWSESLLNKKLVHIDESEDHLARSPIARLHVRGRILSVFGRLAEFMREDLPHLAHTYVKPEFEDVNSHLVLAEGEKCTSDARPIKPQRLMRKLGQLFPENTRFLADAGNSMAWAVHYLQLSDRRQSERRIGGREPAPGRRKSEGGWLRVTVDFAPMGWAIGGAVGTAAGNRDVPVVCITGDGSMLMNGQELSAALAEELTVIFVVLNDAALGMVKHGQQLARAERIAFKLPATDFAAMARAMGAHACTIRTPEDFAALDMDAICKRKGPTLLDVHIDSEEVPPMSLRMRTLGTVV